MALARSFALILFPVDDFTILPLGFIWPTSKNIYERKLGEELTLKCNVTGATEIWWKHRTWSRTRPVTYNNVLRLDNISLPDQGSYVCFAKGSRGQNIESKPQLLLITGKNKTQFSMILTNCLTKSSEVAKTTTFRWILVVCATLEIPLLIYFII